MCCTAHLQGINVAYGIEEMKIAHPKFTFRNPCEEANPTPTVCAPDKNTRGDSFSPVAQLCICPELGSSGGVLLIPLDFFRGGKLAVNVRL